VPTSIEEVKKTNTVMIHPQQWAEFIPKCNPYAMNMDWKRICYSYGDFGYLVRNYRNQVIMGQGKELEYRDN